MEESGSVNLDKFIESEKNGFFAGADCMCISGDFAILTEPRKSAERGRQLLVGHQNAMPDIRSPWY